LKLLDQVWSRFARFCHRLDFGSFSIATWSIIWVALVVMMHDVLIEQPVVCGA
jgi:hypothetical protein